METYGSGVSDTNRFHDRYPSGTIRSNNRVHHGVSCRTSLYGLADSGHERPDKAQRMHAVHTAHLSGLCFSGDRSGEQGKILWNDLVKRKQYGALAVQNITFCLSNRCSSFDISTRWSHNCGVWWRVCSRSTGHSIRSYALRITPPVMNAVVHAPSGGYQENRPCSP